MSSSKEEMIRFIQDLPENLSSDEILYHLYVREEIKKGKKDIQEGKYYTEEQIDELMLQWFR